jgi:hypothetical protein
MLLSANHDGPGRVAFYAFIEEAISLIEMGATALLSRDLIIINIIIGLHLVG